MKNLGAILLSFVLLIGLFPQLTMAAQDSTFEQDLAQYLKEVSEVRGFEVTREDIEASLAAYEESIENFESVGDLSEFLGEVINRDLSNLDGLYEEFELEEESLQLLLEENGEELNDYIFLDDLYSAVYFFTEDGVFERDPNFDQNLVEYLAKVSEERGFEVTKEDIEASLALYQMSLEEFETVEDLGDFLGEVIKADYSNLDYFNEAYELDQQELFQLLAENNDDINHYVYIDDLDQAVWEYYGEELYPVDEEIAAGLLPIFEEIDLTHEELQRIEEHLMSLEEHLSNPKTLERLEALGERMMAFEEFDTATELSVEQIAELASIYNELLSIFQLKTDFSLVKDGSETPLSIIDILKMKELKGANLKVVLSSAGGEFLADFIVTGEMVDSDTVVDTGKQVEESAEEVTKTVEQSPVVAPKPQKDITKVKPVQKTVKGAKLPKTASDYLPNALVGLAIALFGILMFRKVRKA